MRNAFADWLTQKAQQDDRLVLLSGDIGNRLFDKFKAASPERFYNCGVAEANMTSIASGMALSGLRPITYTIASFATLRCLEQIRFGLCYPNLPAIVVGVGAGLGYAELNASHHSLEDIACLRAIPNMRVLNPADAYELRACLEAAWESNGPVYIRMGKKGEPLLHKGDVAVDFGRWIPIRQGADICLLATGPILGEAIKAAATLAAVDVSVELWSCPSVKPLDEKILHQLTARFDCIVTLEEHGVAGGFGSAVAEWVSQCAEQRPRIVAMGTRNEFMYPAGDQEYAREFFGIDAAAIARTINASLHGTA